MEALVLIMTTIEVLLLLVTQMNKLRITLTHQLLLYG